MRVSFPPGLLVNPFDYPQAPYVTAVIGILLVTTFAMVVFAAAIGRGGVSGKTLFARWLTWAVLAPVWAFACGSGLLPIAVLLTALAILGIREWARLTGLPRVHRDLLVVYSVIAGWMALMSAAAVLATIPVLAVVSTLQPLVSRDVRHGMRDLAYGALGFAYLPLMLCLGILVARDVDHGTEFLFETGVAVACSDVLAYVIGKRFGRHRLAPAISPNKTVEGLAGNVIGAIAGYAVFIPMMPEVPIVLPFVLAIVVAVGAVWGDLFESALKREASVKDAGSWVPGFGGILDRIDSLIVAIPLLYYALLIIGFARQVAVATP